MGDCDRCDGDDRISYTCNYCGGGYCSHHRLPEAHNCFSGSYANDNSSEFASPLPSFWLRARSALPILFVGVIVLSATYGTGIHAIDDNVARTLETGADIGGDVLSSIENGTDGDEQDTPTENTPTAVSSSGATLDQDELRKAIHERVNDIRADRGAGRLSYNDRLESVARSHSEDMASKGYFSHDSPSGVTMSDRYDQHNVDCNARGENILRLTAGTDEQSLATTIVDGWMNSRGHRDNILHSGWNSEAIGVAKGGGSLYITQNFC